MVFLISSVILTSIVLLLTYFLYFKNDQDSNIPYAKYCSYPIIGHLIHFLRNRIQLLLESSKRYGSCFKIKVLNQTFIIISSYADWMNVVKNQSFKFMGAEFGSQIFDLSPGLLDVPELDHGLHRLYVKHLKNRDGLRPMIIEFIHQMRILMKNDKLKFEQKNTSASDWVSTGLLEFSHHMLFQPSTLALFGEFESTSMENDFRLFDKSFHYFFAPFPKWIYSQFFSRELQAQSRLNELWLKTRESEKASEFHRDRAALFSANSQWLSDQDYGKLLTGFFWASLGNTIPAVFWCLFYILQDSKALKVIQEEMNIYLPDVPLDCHADSSSHEDWTPEQLDACVYLESAVNETIRLVGAPFMTRQCIRKTDLNLKDGRTITIKPGENLAWFGGASHFDDNLFPQADRFIFDRFLNKKADMIPGFMPFGGGKSICPGRFFAKYEIKTCVAMLLRYMEYKFPNIEAVPNQILSRIGVGIAPPSKDIQILYRYKI